MKRWIFSACAVLALSRGGFAQDYATSGQEFVGPGSVGSNEPLFSYDDQERWKHGWLQVMPYYGGYESFRPYNYHHVFGQATTAQGWGMSMPYSQQFWHRYENMTNLALTAPTGDGLLPIPQQHFQYPQQPQNFQSPQQPQNFQYPQQQLHQHPVPTPAPAPQPVPQAGWQMPQQGAYQTQYIQPTASQIPQQQMPYVQQQYPQQHMPVQQQQMLNYLQGPALPGYGGR